MDSLVFSVYSSHVLRLFVLSHFPRIMFNKFENQNWFTHLLLLLLLLSLLLLLLLVVVVVVVVVAAVVVVESLSSLLAS